MVWCHLKLSWDMLQSSTQASDMSQPFYTFNPLHTFTILEVISLVSRTWRNNCILPCCLNKLGWWSVVEIWFNLHNLLLFIGGEWHDTDLGSVQAFIGNFIYLRARCWSQATLTLISMKLCNLLNCYLVSTMDNVPSPITFTLIIVKEEWHFMIVIDRF